MVIRRLVRLTLHAFEEADVFLFRLADEVFFVHLFVYIVLHRLRIHTLWLKLFRSHRHNFNYGKFSRHDFTPKVLVRSECVLQKEKLVLVYVRKFMIIPRRHTLLGTLDRPFRVPHNTLLEVRAQCIIGPDAEDGRELLDDVLSRRVLHSHMYLYLNL